MSNKPQDRETAAEEDIRFRDVAPALEFMCWLVVLLAPFLRWANGPPLTDDQAFFQITLVVTALTGAIGLKILSWRYP